MTAAEQQTAQATWGIPSAVRRVIKAGILDLRRKLEDDFERQLNALGITSAGVKLLPAGRTLETTDARARNVAAAVINQTMDAGLSSSEAFDDYVRDSAYTFLNRVVGLRCLDERGMLIVDGHPETSVRIDPARNASSLYWGVRNEMPATTRPRDVWRETIRRACDAIGKRVRVLFDPDSEHAVLSPMQATLDDVIAFLNSDQIPPATWAEDELLGWVYQYYNADEKDVVYAKLGTGKKFERPEDIIAATCLYTERYMVDYLLQNTLGAYWVEMYPDSELPRRWPYFVRPPEGNPPVERDQKRVRDITLLDPACGSCHFLVRAFDLFVQMYMEEGIEQEDEIASLILERNLYGIDIDQRAIQIGALALYLKGCDLVGSEFRPRSLNLVPADATLSSDGPPEQYLARFQGDPQMIDLVNGIWVELKNVRELGSLLHPERAVDEMVDGRRQRDRGSFFEQDAAHWEAWKVDLLSGLREEFELQAGSQDLGQRLFGEQAARGVSLVEVLSRRYDVVVVNPPYAGSKSFNANLKRFIDREYREGKRDLYAAFILRCFQFAVHRGKVGAVTQQSWMFLQSFLDLRRHLLSQMSITSVVHLGPRAFDEISGEVVTTVLITCDRTRADSNHRFRAIRAVAGGTPQAKSMTMLNVARDALAYLPVQDDLLKVPNHLLVYWLSEEFVTLLSSSDRFSSILKTKQGIVTGDNDRFLRYFWEAPIGNDYDVYLKGMGFKRWYGLTELCIDWHENRKHIAKLTVGRIKTSEDFSHRGWAYSLMAGGNMSPREYHAGWRYDNGGPVVFPKAEDFYIVGAILGSHLGTLLLRYITQGDKFNSYHLDSLPRWTKKSSFPFDETVPWLVNLTRERASRNLLNRDYQKLLKRSDHPTLESALIEEQREDEACSATALAMQGSQEDAVLDAYGASDGQRKILTGETGTPAGWLPSIVGMDEIPIGISSTVLSQVIRNSLSSHPRIESTIEHESELRAQLKHMYTRGWDNVQKVDLAKDPVNLNQQAQRQHPDAYVPIPSESLLEELSRKLNTHPFTIYWLLEELREENIVCEPELRQRIADAITIMMLTALGFRWPGQILVEGQRSSRLGKDLVDEDGIIPIVRCASQPVAVERIRGYLEEQFGVEGAVHSERQIARWLKRDLEQWLQQDFFKRNVQQFKQRPIAW